MEYSLTLEKIYLDWVNNYLSITKFAHDNNLTLMQAKKLIVLSKNVYELGNFIDQVNEFSS